MGQMVVAGLQTAHRRRQASTQSQQMLLNPVFDLVEPMVTFRQDEGEPEHTEFPRGQAMPIAVGHKVLIQQGDQLHVTHLFYQQGDVVDAFRDDRDCFGHPPSLPNSGFPVSEMSEP
jgi:hypothetical protein